MPEETARPTGYIDTLTTDQEKLLYSFWTRILEYFSKPLAEDDKVGLSKKQIKDKLKKSRDLSKSLEQTTLNDSASVASETSSLSANILAAEFWNSIRSEDVDVFLLRFLRARKWSIDAAFDMIIGCLKWRTEIGMRKLVVEGEMKVKKSLLESGKTYFHGVDKNNRLVGWIKVGLHDKNGQTTEENERFTIYQMETARLLFPKKSETVSMVFDMSDFSLQCMDYPSLKFLISCMEAYYPESLGIALVVNAPWIFWGCWKVIKPWLDPVVASKVHFIKKEELKNFVSEEYLPPSYGGSSPYEYFYDDKQPTEVPSPDPIQLSTLNFKYESLQEQFRHVTFQLHEFIDRQDLAEADQVAKLKKDRDEMKSELNILMKSIDKLVLTKNIYERIGILSDDGSVNWNIKKISK